MNRWLIILFIWYMWIAASSIMMMYVGKFGHFEMNVALTYMAIPTFVYFVYHARLKKRRHSTNTLNRTIPKE